VLRGKPASAVQDMEFISLDLGTGGDIRTIATKSDGSPRD
jgi:hypothetical protein